MAPKAFCSYSVCKKGLLDKKARGQALDKVEKDHLLRMHSETPVKVVVHGFTFVHTRNPANGMRFQCICGREPLSRSTIQQHHPCPSFDFTVQVADFVSIVGPEQQPAGDPQDELEGVDDEEGDEDLVNLGVEHEEDDKDLVNMEVDDEEDDKGLVNMEVDDEEDDKDLVNVVVDDEEGDRDLVNVYTYAPNTNAPYAPNAYHPNNTVVPDLPSAAGYSSDMVLQRIHLLEGQMEDLSRRIQQSLESHGELTRRYEEYVSRLRDQEREQELRQKRRARDQKRRAKDQKRRAKDQKGRAKDRKGRAKDQKGRARDQMTRLEKKVDKGLQSTSGPSTSAMPGPSTSAPPGPRSNPEPAVPDQSNPNGGDDPYIQACYQD
ncbi:hypothetical protein DFQ27_008387 [Actinomortierella ambigua]|uniref:Uncharacterized protein n=1 Tax=Actinomortierella ambigua TaxID=1343610 RepID=A0A9P6QH22_9FUNG|nr:hypothetical protein DFQ27_008387 [Actinomortierella ambigua]